MVVKKKKNCFGFKFFPAINVLLITSKISQVEGDYFCSATGIVKYQHVGADIKLFLKKITFLFFLTGKKIVIPTVYAMDLFGIFCFEIRSICNVLFKHIKYKSTK